ncbi:MAG: hypothetical protein IPL26_00125 [Leptospiraceae bacterium]|nr:hypothetical protein [Leptospiraceae bacterium]
MEQEINLTDEQKAAFGWIQSQLETVEILKEEIQIMKVALKNLIQITDSVTVLAPYRKSEAYAKIKDAIKELK